jgi:hypothetical protein
MLLNHSAIDGFAEETSVFSPKSIYDYRRFCSFVTSEIHKQALEETSDIVGFFVRLHVLGLSSQKTDRTIFVEKTPQHVRRIKFILKKFPNAKIIHVVRDGRDAFCSGRSAGNIPQAERVEVYARYWKSCVRQRLLVEDQRVFDLKYEELVSDAEKELRRMMEFLKIPPELERQLSPQNRAADARSDRAAFRRLAGDIANTTVGRWKTEMSALERKVFWRIAADELNRFHYRN